ncbi:hypothetical protein FJ976_01545 [Mesorhizobium sp. B1-1-9]|uniref:hypothetical protein n=1 Tax=Mesorhizobium sp. B1-1-9 TaxID=2589975 RepID=UPI001125CB4E|nr:hypothetical protein [Mesorhizobium sp. B1-1-9]TPN58622.1 hypothetical protein FJ976_01545 [Mesorhizobium sp. B1-1-9]
MFNRSEIMKSAHRYAQAYKGREWSYAFLLAAGLRSAWAVAKSGLTETQRRSDAIRAEIDGLKFKSLNVNIEPRRRVLETELSTLAA